MGKEETFSARADHHRTDAFLQPFQEDGLAKLQLNLDSTETITIHQMEAAGTQVFLCLRQSAF